MLTTRAGYGTVPTHRQGELVRAAGEAAAPLAAPREQVAALEALLAALRG